jgi:5-methylcytosine-specific restriction endonuclease McrA
MPNSAGKYDKAWRAIRLEVLGRDGWRCQLCGRQASAVDHIVPLAERPDLRLERSNLRAICTPCNTNRENGRRKMKIRIDANPSRRRQW